MKKLVTAQYRLMLGNTHCGSCVHFEIMLPTGRILDITGDRLHNISDAFDSAFAMANTTLAKFGLSLSMKNTTELLTVTPPITNHANGKSYSDHGTADHVVTRILTKKTTRK